MEKKVYFRPYFRVMDTTEYDVVVMSDGFSSDKYDNEFDLGGGLQ